jgi:hypothetical protein
MHLRGRFVMKQRDVVMLSLIVLFALLNCAPFCVGQPNSGPMRRASEGARSRADDYGTEDQSPSAKRGAVSWDGAAKHPTIQWRARVSSFVQGTDTPNVSNF